MQLRINQAQNIQKDNIDDYMLLTDKLHLDALVSEFVIVNKDHSKYHVRKMSSENDRQKQTDVFKNVVGDNALYELEIDFEGNLDELKQNLFGDYANIISIVTGYCVSNKESALIIPHFLEKDEEQSEKYLAPHIHIIFEQKTNDSLRDYIKEELDKLR